MRRVFVILTICLALAVGLIAYLRLGDDAIFRVVFFDVGQGDSALIRFDDGQKMLVDCGIGRKVLSKLGDYLPFYDRNLDFLLITHFDNDHYGGCLDVLRRYEVKTIVENGTRKENDKYWQEWDALAARAGAERKVISGPEVWEIGGAKLEFFSPDSSLALGDKISENNRSIVFRLTHAGESLFFAGDMETLLENALLDRYCPASSTPCAVLRSGLLKAGHHGSDTSSGESFLRAVAPVQAVVSVGQNTFGHPSLRTLRHLERVGAAIWRTDEMGDILFP